MNSCHFIHLSYERLLSKVDKFAGLDFQTVGIIDDLVIRCQSTVMEVLVLVDTGVVVMCEGRARGTCARVNTSHVVPNCVWIDRDRMRYFPNLDIRTN